MLLIQLIVRDQLIKLNKQKIYLQICYKKIKQEQMKKINSLKNSQNNKQICAIHNLVLKYFCVDCKFNICSDCGLIQQKHKDHQITPISQQKNLSFSKIQIQKITSKLDRRLFSYKQQHKRLILQQQLLKSQIKYNKTKIYQYYQELIIKLQQQAKYIMQEIQSKLKQCQNKIQQKTKVKYKMQEIMKNNVQLSIKKKQNTLQKGTLIRSSKQIQKEIQLPMNKINQMLEIKDKQLLKYLFDFNYISIQQQSKQNLNQSKREMIKQKFKRLSSSSSFFDKEQQKNKFQSSQINQLSFNQNLEYLQLFNQKLNHLSFLDRKIYQLGIMKQIYPEYTNFSFQLDYLLERNNQIVYSQRYQIFGFQWRLKIYPKGNSQVENKYISVFLQLVGTPDHFNSNIQKQYFFRLQLLNLNMAGKSIIKQYKCKFKVGQCWGYAQFTDLQQTTQYLHDGKLLFVMGVRNVSYYDLCDNMKKYITKIQGQNKVLAELCQNYGGDMLNNRGINEQLDNMDRLSSYIYHEDEVSSIISSVQDEIQ